MIKFLDYLVGSIIAAGALTAIYLFIAYGSFGAKLVVGLTILGSLLLFYVTARTEGMLK
jgi:hypothetical protein